MLIALPFILLLALIVIAPLTMPKWWHHYYKHTAIALGAGVGLYYIFAIEHGGSTTFHTFWEYLSFVLFLSALFIASGGIYIHADIQNTAKNNVIFLLAGAIISNIIGTTGAAMLLVRPFIRLNKYRIKPYHLVFFIFIVCNVGGSLTPIGDPPLFLGFLKGVPFFFTLNKLFGYWVLAIALLLGIFYLKDKKDENIVDGDEVKASNKFIINGKRNIIWLTVIIGAIFIDPNLFPSLPTLHVHGHHYSFIRELIQLTSAILCFKFAKQSALKGNGFDFEPIKEIAFIFFGLFLTMMPALQIVADFAKTPKGQALFTPNTMYWASGIFSAFLDNAPTYLNFLTAGLAKFGLSIDNSQDVIQFANSENAIYVIAISLGAVFFGAMTYIGNGPNFMVKSVAEHLEIKMPSFIDYIIKYSVIYLLPVLTVTFGVMWLLN